MRLKWHRLRTDFAEAPFKPRKLALGWQLGATLEIDILACGDGRFAVLHDVTLGPKTTGTGRVAETPLSAMAGLHHRDRAGVPDAEAPVLSLAELLRPLAALPRAPGASLQLDLKVLERLGVPKRAIADAARAADGIGDGIVIGSHFLPEARRLAEAIPGARLGYDPMLAASRNRDLLKPERMLRHMERRADGVSIAYLHYHAIASAAEAGFPLVDRLLGLGIETDAWTLNPGPKLSDKLLRTLLLSGVRQITTDAPAELARRIIAVTAAAGLP